MNQNEKFTKLTKDESGKLRGGFSIHPIDVKTKLENININCDPSGYQDINVNCSIKCQCSPDPGQPDPDPDS